MQNLDLETVEGFGEEWSRFDQSGSSEQEQRDVFDMYFAIFPWEKLRADAVGFDAGCGSGRWARLVAGRVGKLICVDASARALEVARQNLAAFSNVELLHASVDGMPIADESADFGYSLGVLHHMPDTAAAIRALTRKLKVGAPLLLYLYYRFDDRQWWFRSIWSASNMLRHVICRMPSSLRYAASQALAAGVYWPLARGARIAERLGANVAAIPLSAYRNRSLYVMRNDALDRFGTRLEHRFTREEIRTMMEAAGLARITFSESVPYWCAVGYRAK